LPINFDPSLALTDLLYSGEIFDQRTEMQYLRARYYNPATGTFNRLDPFLGSFIDPQSLHKYLYVHGDPISGADPTGQWSLNVSLSSMTIRGALIGGGVGVLAGYAYGVYVTGEWFSLKHVKYMLIGGLAGAAIGATIGAFIGYAGGASTGLSSGGALHNFVKIAHKLWTVPRAMGQGTMAAGKGRIFASFVVGAAAGAWAAVAEDDPYTIGLFGGGGASALATETPMSIAYQGFIKGLMMNSGSKFLSKLAVSLSGAADIVIAFTIGFNVGYALSKGVQIGTDQIVSALED
jgi:RHS repeat-associated protein